MRRGPAQTRYYLEVAVTDTTADWPEPRVRQELAVRLGVGCRLDNVPFGDIGLLDLRVRVIEPMQQGRLFLAGDAAHLITPAGWQGSMSLSPAIRDAVELAHAGSSTTVPGGPKNDDTRDLSLLADRPADLADRGPASNWFHLRIILAQSLDGEEPAKRRIPGGFGRDLQAGIRVTALQGDPLLARWFAHAYSQAREPPGLMASPTVGDVLLERGKGSR
jgi:p-hydroxybenzoate 3-monooxygenase